MEKVTMGAKTWVYPMPVILVGANIDGKPNFMTVAWGGVAGGDPPMISVALRHQRYTLTGVRQNLCSKVSDNFGIQNVGFSQDACRCLIWQERGNPRAKE